MLSLGSIQLDAPMVQAALAGYSDAPMRLLAREYGCPFTINEVVLDKFVAQGGKKMRKMLAIPDHDRPVGCQIMGNSPDEFATAADELVSLGYDLIDINFGCPVKKVLGRNRGGFLLSTPDRACKILCQVYESVQDRVPVTVKMRRGMDNSRESERNFFSILNAAFETGLTAVTVHGRTVEQRYVGPSDWSFLTRVKRHVGTRTIIGSGDLFTAHDAKRMLESTGVDGVSFARGAIGNPFIFREFTALLAGNPLPSPPSIREQRAAIERQFELMTNFHGERIARRLFRKYGVRYSELHPCHDEVKMAFVQVRHASDWDTMLDRWYAPDREYPPVVRRPRPESLIAAGATMEIAQNDTRKEAEDQDELR